MEDVLRFLALWADHVSENCAYDERDRDAALFIRGAANHLRTGFWLRFLAARDEQEQKP